MAGRPDEQRVVITGIGLTAPNGNSLPEFRQSLLAGRSGVTAYETRYFGPTLAGVCNFDELRYQKRKDVRRGTRAGGIGIYCATRRWPIRASTGKTSTARRVGIYVGVTEHGNVETENEIYQLKGYDYDTQYWSHHHNPRTVANNPAGEISLNLGITGPHYTLGARLRRRQCGHHPGRADAAAGRLRHRPVAAASRRAFTRSAFSPVSTAKGRWPSTKTRTKASRPFDLDRNGIVVAEGGCLFVLERLPDARARGAKIYGEVAGYAMNSDAIDFVLPDPGRQAECIRLALRRAGMNADEIGIVSTHATGTTSGDAQECQALRRSGASNGHHTLFNNTKSFIGHAMGAAGALELAGNLPAFDDGVCHATINLDRPRPAVRAARPGGQPAARGGQDRRHPEQFVRNAGNQLGGDRQADLEEDASETGIVLASGSPDHCPSRLYLTENSP